jgi:hypothetical protein
VAVSYRRGDRCPSAQKKPLGTVSGAQATILCSGN